MHDSRKVMDRGSLCRLTVALIACAGLLPYGSAFGLTFTENFESWAWNPGCVSEGTQYGSCFTVAGCGAGHPLFPRRVSNPGQCGYWGQIRDWVGGGNAFHGEWTDVASQWVAVHLGETSTSVAEWMTSRDKQAGTLGTLQADYFLDEDKPPTNEHYLLMHNLQLTQITDGSCLRDCSTVANTRTNYGSAKPPATDSTRYKFYAAIGGWFGDVGPDSIGFGLHGFAVEVPTDGGHELVNESYMQVPLTPAGKLPGGWYRLQIQRHLVCGVDTYTYSVRRWNAALAVWQLVTLDATPTETGFVPNTSNPRSFPATALYRYHSAGDLPVGYVALVDASLQPGVIVAWDNVVVNW